MSEANQILVVIDPTAKQQPALERAAWWAQKTGAGLELFICDYDQYLAGERFFDTESLEKARGSLMNAHEQRLGKLAEPLRAQGLTVAVEAQWDHPLHEGIVRKTLRSKPDLVFKDTHYHAAIRRSLFSNTDWNLIRDCPAPLWLVKPTPNAAELSIIAAIDPVHERDKPAELDSEILAVARKLMDRAGGRISVLHAFDPSPAYAVSADSMAFPISAPMNEMMEALKNRHKQAVDELMEDQGIPAEDTHVLEGDTRELLIDLAEQVDANLVVMGAVSRGALQRLVLGSTAERVLDHIPCDLLIVKPSGFAPDVTL